MTLQTDDYKYLMDFYWNHFELHSKQRMQMMQFYLSIIVILFGALFTLRNLDTRITIAEVITSLGITIISIVFLLLDSRTSILIKDAENSIREIEKKLIPEENNKIALFIQSEKLDSKRKYVSYSKCIVAIEGLISLLGIAIAIATNFEIF